MYCRNCGKELTDGTSFCPDCGQSVNGGYTEPVPVSVSSENKSDKCRLIAALLAYFLGVFGGHNFYVGRTKKAVTQLILTVTVIGILVSGIWVFVDFIYILCGKYTDGDGKVIDKWLDN